MIAQLNDSNHEFGKLLHVGSFPCTKPMTEVPALISARTHTHGGCYQRWQVGCTVDALLKNV